MKATRHRFQSEGSYYWFIRLPEFLRLSEPGGSLAAFTQVNSYSMRAEGEKATCDNLIGNILILHAPSQYARKLWQVYPGSPCIFTSDFTIFIGDSELSREL
jgi:hypothetical protein